MRRACRASAMSPAARCKGSQSLPLADLPGLPPLLCRNSLGMVVLLSQTGWLAAPSRSAFPLAVHVSCPPASILEWQQDPTPGPQIKI